MNLLTKSLAALIASLILAGSAGAQQKRPLDHDAYARWSTIEGPQMSARGSWVAYGLEPGDKGDGRVLVRQAVVHRDFCDIAFPEPQHRSRRGAVDHEYLDHLSRGGTGDLGNRQVVLDGLRALCDNAGRE